MKYPFKLSKTNLIYSAVVICLMSLIKVFTFGPINDGFDRGYLIGDIIGILFITFLIPILFALFIWFVRRRQAWAGTTTFNIVLSVVVGLSGLAKLGKMSQIQRDPINKMSKAVSDYKNSVSNVENISEIDSSYRVMSSDVHDAVDKMIEESTGEDKVVYKTFKHFLRITNNINLEWTNAVDQFSNERILDLTQFDDKSEYEYQKKIVKRYIDKSNVYKNFMENRIEIFESEAIHIDKNNEVYRGMLRGMVRKDSLQRPIVLPFIQYHILYGEEMYSLLELLEVEHDNWSYNIEDSTVVFQDSVSQEKYDYLLFDLYNYESTLISLSDSVMKVM